MMETNNLAGIKIDIKFVKKIVDRILRGERKNKAEISIAFVRTAKIRQLNKKYRKNNQATDVLSFNYENHSGEIVICPEVIKKNARNYNSTFKKELARVLIHGILHLLGYNHEKMGKKENYYFKICRR